MNITHYIVSVKDLNKMMEVMAYSFSTSPEDNNAIPVDLSEEGIHDRAEKANTMFSIDTSEAYFGYVQCAKDLLNTKL